MPRRQPRPAGCRLDEAHQGPGCRDDEQDDHYHSRAGQDRSQPRTAQEFRERAGRVT